MQPAIICLCSLSNTRTSKTFQTKVYILTIHTDILRHVTTEFIAVYLKVSLTVTNTLVVVGKPIEVGGVGVGKR